METINKREKIKSLVLTMLEDSYDSMVRNIDKALDSGAIDVDGWDETMILPKCILTAVLEQESTQYSAKGTSFEKEVKKEVKNIRYFL